MVFQEAGGMLIKSILQG